MSRRWGYTVTPIRPGYKCQSPSCRKVAAAVVRYSNGRRFRYCRDHAPEQPRVHEAPAVPS